MLKRKLKPWVPKPAKLCSPKYGAVRPVNAVLPPLVDLEPLCPPVYDQLQTSSCEGNALAELFDFLQLQELKAKVAPGSQAPEEFNATGYVPCSRRFIYYNTCVVEGTAGQDGGVTSAADGCEQMIKVGVCDETLCPFGEDVITQKPSDAAYCEAAAHKVGSYFELENLQDMLHCLSQGFPFACGIAIYESFQSDEVAQSGIVPMPQPGEACDGGHEVSIVGFDMTKQMFKLRNSWGAGWGQRGYCWIPFKYISNLALASEFVTIRK